MANPPNALVIGQPMDPADVKDWQVNLSQGIGNKDVLQTGEQVASFTLATTAEAAAAGLTIMNTSGYATMLVGTALTFWLAVAAGSQSNAGYVGAGMQLGLVLTLLTNASPQRQIRKTIVIKVAGQ